MQCMIYKKGGGRGEGAGGGGEQGHVMSCYVRGGGWDEDMNIRKSVY